MDKPDLLAELDEAEFCRCGKRHEECDEDGGCWWTAAQDELRRLRARVDDLAAYEPRLGGFGANADGEPVVDVRFPESFARLMFASFRWYLDEHGAPNYVHMPMTDMTTGEQYFCTIGRPGGKSPHELRRAAEGRLAQAERILEEALHLRMNGECAPGGNETWAGWDRKAEVYLQETLPAP